jgi:hypothetical protein
VIEELALAQGIVMQATYDNAKKLKNPITTYTPEEILA